MEWPVEYTDEFDAWWGKLSEEEQIVIAAKVELLEKHGPTLPRPHSDVIVTSRHSNMKELRGKAGERVLRVLYAFDPRRVAILLIGGDKSGSEGWYEEFVPIADRLFDEHLAALKKESQEKVICQTTSRPFVTSCGPQPVNVRTAWPRNMKRRWPWTNYASHAT